ncbi:hypothetical protein A2160_00100 [Candidatus Beckwithbacteria bacterium RBG_13_42_9]|uniref:Phosphodiester glycosidase domain-containing protein n=1 Tax=Candidatus Beckwithbacteria bacterium RBG_13_42_9 TaxID=1797457 RepID=A0A1F5E4Z9_9BACT|nr:MAG: hypothetical protein A2160_00100 [Candidatus Beckwithbacteria bacterium RBG_13_42_9]
MAKQIAVIVALILVIVVGIRLVTKVNYWRQFLTSASPVAVASPVPLPNQTQSAYTLSLEKLTKITFGQETFRFGFQKIDDPAELELFPNFEAKKAAKNLMTDNNCRFLINSGFYSPENKPLGWFFSQGELLNLPENNRLLNGFMSSNEAAGVVITDLPPQGMVKWGFQSGPLLVVAGQKLPLAIRDDEYKRRAVAALTQTGELIFFVITTEESLNAGPPLADLPSVIDIIGQSLNEHLVSAINLDGGSASAFLSQEIQIDEVSLIGSYLCWQQ